ncbi:unnamed protein product [Dibothriocephalus latus]|uniref:Wiskott-Aldrich syndrome protein family member n=1 Tax=Dibothriocephalus latus TaxID=60516 RepID=A0A3P7LN22_DIBLA|nr:unnamed protein product [Dibothriocephalus latus]
MPLPEHTIQPSHISLVSVSQQIKNELEFVSNESFCNLMYQMSSVINAAVDIFDELSTKLASLSNRFDSVEQRVASMSETAKQLPTSEDCLSVGLQNLSMQPFAGTHTEDSQVLHRNTKPACMRLCYEKAEPPPPLHVMDALRDDGKTTSRLYSDPRFFFDLWSKEMLEECNTKKTPRKKVRLPSPPPPPSMFCFFASLQRLYPNHYNHQAKFQVVRKDGGHPHEGFIVQRTPSCCFGKQLPLTRPGLVLTASSHARE